MEKSSTNTYAAILDPIAEQHRPSISYPLSTAANGELCESCLLIFDPLLHPTVSYHKSRYDREDVFPDFPSLQVTAAQGCQLCPLIRTAIQTAWAVRPMEELRLGTIRTQDKYWDRLLATEWDARVTINCRLVRHAILGVDKHEWPFSGLLGITYGPFSLSKEGELVQVGQSRHYKVCQGTELVVYTTKGGLQID
jgi:hypothetical protein